MNLTKRSGWSGSLILVCTVISLFLGDHLVQGLDAARAASIEGVFDTSQGSNVFTGNFVSNPLPVDWLPAVDGEIQAFLQDGGYSYAPLGWSLTAEPAGYQECIMFGNVYVTYEINLTSL